MNKYIAMLKAAKSKQEIMDITYEAFKDNEITGKQHDILTDLGVLKEQYIQGKNAGEINECISVLRIPKKYAKMIR